MIDNEPQFETLSAYVDSELPSPHREWLDRRIDNDHRLAREVAALRQMKAGVASLGKDVVLLQMPAHETGYRLPWRAAAAVAAAMLIIAVAAAYWIAPPFLRHPAAPQSETTRQAVALYDNWVGGSANLLSAPVVKASDSLSLDAAGLTLVSLRTDLVIAEAPATQAGYLGHHGCRLSLFKIAKTDGNQAFEISTLGDLQTARWATASFMYVAVARKLDATRFAVLAGALRSMTGSREPAPLDLVAQLKTAQQPCHG